MTNNVLFILHLPPPVHGSSMVGQSIKNSKLINNSFDCRYVNILVSRAINETGKPSSIKILRFIGVWFKLLAEVLKKKPDVCYLALTATGSAFYKDVLLVALLRAFHIKRVYHLHNKGFSQNSTNKAYNFFYRFVFKDADIILLSIQLYSDIKKFVPLSHVTICPNGIADANINTQSILLKEKPVKIMFLSNLCVSKGVLILLEACSILQQRGIEFEIDFVGAEGDLNATQFSEKAMKHQLNSKAKYLGKKYDVEKQNIFETSDIFIHPTLSDCFPLVLLEAMQYSLPVVSTFEGGISDIVEDGITGYLVPQKNVEALAEKLESLIKDPELRHQMGKAGRQKYESEFTLNAFETRLKNILQQVLDKQ